MLCDSLNSYGVAKRDMSSYKSKPNIESGLNLIDRCRRNGIKIEIASYYKTRDYLPPLEQNSRIVSINLS